MSTCRSVLSKIANQVTNVALPALVSAIAKYQGIEDARDIDDSDLKKAIKKDFAILSNVVNTAEFAAFSIPCLFAIYGNWNYLTAKQKALIVGISVLATASGIYSFTQSGIEQTSMTTGGIASGSCALFFTAKELAEHFAINPEDEIPDLNKSFSTYSQV